MAAISISQMPGHPAPAASMPAGRAAGRPAAAPGATPAPEAPAPIGPRGLPALAREIPWVLQDLRRAEARLIAAEAACLCRMKDRRQWLPLGFSSFADLLRETLGTSRSAAADRIALHHLLQARPAVREAFLEGRVSSCQALALLPILNHQNEQLWLDKCRHLSVRAIKAAVREALRRKAADDAGQADATTPALDTSRPDEGSPEDDPGRCISFSAPPEVVIAWEAGLETARRVLGRQAPRYACVEAILAEALPEAGAAPEAGTRPEAEAAAEPEAVTSCRTAHPHPPARRWHSCRVRPPVGEVPWPDPSVTGRPAAVARAWRTFELAWQELDRLEEVFLPQVPDRAVEVLDALREVRASAQPLRVLLARVLRDAWQSRAVHFLGFHSLAGFVEYHLKLSERTARTLLAEADLFRDFPTLETAYSSGRIGIGQALLLRRVTSPRRLPDHVARAAGITCRQLRREMRFLEMLADVRPAQAARFDGPLPLPGLEEALGDDLKARGLDPATIAGAAGAPNTPYSDDPAENPLVLRRLEALLEAVALADCRARTAEQDAAMAGTAAPDEARTAALSACPSPACTSPEIRQTFGHGPDLSTPAPPMKTIRFRAPLAVADHWDAAIRLLRRRADDPDLPTWACVTLLLARALEEWHRHDPDAIPTQHKTLQRDEYLCQAPGCSARRNLEVHHIVFRSNGGRDIPANRITLCHTHHASGIHGGAIRLSGPAPRSLRWETPFGNLQGDKYEPR